MKRQNQSSVVEFILLGFSNFPELQEQLFGVFLVVYLGTLMGNAIIIVIISLEQSLHVPMYLFLQNLSVVDVSFSAVIMPEMLVVLSTEKTLITFAECFAQMYFLLLFGGTECFLLGAMAYDRFAAICHPLSYPMIMNKRVFMKQKAFSTCASHLTSVTLFYGTANMTYIQPKSGYSPETKKVMSLSYSLLTPLLNPLIYSLRNSEMKRALMKLWRRKVNSHIF
ncbi:olfactory receptor 10A3-like [Puma concolor]|uniref:Olfactory receptor 10A3-like n=1 Tax=Puma concolor TaxID=9696 RepID=A0A6P6IBV0_PUMCO|nr:olfactory receptor 10A3-like [Puma concolor]